MNENETGLDATPPDRRDGLAASVAAATTRTSTVDAPRPADTQRVSVDASQIRADILRAIAATTDSPPVRLIAFGMFAVDCGEMRGADDAAQARLDRAIARGLLDAWTHGQCSAEAVGAAYVLAADRVAGVKVP